MPQERAGEEVQWLIQSVGGEEAVFRCRAVPGQDNPVCVRANVMVRVPPSTTAR
jgi:hypothetical protein